MKNVFFRNDLSVIAFLVFCLTAFKAQADDPILKYSFPKLEEGAYEYNVTLYESQVHPEGNVNNFAQITANIKIWKNDEDQICVRFMSCTLLTDPEGNRKMTVEGLENEKLRAVVFKSKVSIKGNKNVIERVRSDNSVDPSLHAAEYIHEKFMNIYFTHFTEGQKQQDKSSGMLPDPEGYSNNPPFTTWWVGNDYNYLIDLTVEILSVAYDHYTVEKYTATTHKSLKISINKTKQIIEDLQYVRKSKSISTAMYPLGTVSDAESLSVIRVQHPVE